MRPISDTLRDIGAGQLIEQAGEELRAVVLAVDSFNKPGELTIKIKVKPASKASGAVTVGYDVTSKKPQGERPSHIMWGTPEGDLLASDPRQQKLDLRDVSAKPAEGATLKTITA